MSCSITFSSCFMKFQSCSMKFKRSFKRKCIHMESADFHLTEIIVNTWCRYKYISFCTQQIQINFYSEPVQLLIQDYLYPVLVGVFHSISCFGINTPASYLVQLRIHCYPHLVQLRIHCYPYPVQLRIHRFPHLVQVRIKPTYFLSQLPSTHT